MRKHEKQQQSRQFTQSHSLLAQLELSSSQSKIQRPELPEDANETTANSYQ